MLVKRKVSFCILWLPVYLKEDPTWVCKSVVMDGHWHMYLMNLSLHCFSWCPQLFCNEEFINNLSIGVSQLFFLALQALRKSSSLLTSQMMILPLLPMMLLMTMISCECFVPVRNGILLLKHWRRDNFLRRPPQIFTSVIAVFVE